MRIEKSVQGLKGEDTKRCPECKSRKIVREKDEVYCEDCGYVIE